MAARSSPVARRPLGRHAGHADFERSPCLEHLGPRKAVERRKKAERLTVEHRRAVRDERAGAVANHQHAFRRQQLKAGAHRRAAHANFPHELAFGRQALAAVNLAADDLAADELRHHVRGDAIVWPDLLTLAWRSDHINRRQNISDHIRAIKAEMV